MLKQNKLTKKSSEVVEKRKPGRPKGSAPTFNETVLVKNSIREAIIECERRGSPIHLLIADEIMQGSPSKVLSALGRFMPAEVNLHVSTGFSDALKEVNDRLKIIDHDDVDDIDDISADD